MVNAFLPQEPHFLKLLSKLNAIRGKYPKSSNNVNIGKNIAIGGSITATTHARTLYMPKTKIPWRKGGIFIIRQNSLSLSWNLNNISDKISEG